MYTERFSEVHYPLAVDHADSLGAGTTYTAYVSLQNYHRAVAVIDVGDMAGTATFIVQVMQATSIVGAGAKVIAGKAITIMTQAGGDGNEIRCIEVKAEELDVDGGFDCIALRFIYAAAATEFSAILYGIEPRYAPVPTTNWAEIVD